MCIRDSYQCVRDRLSGQTNDHFTVTEQKTRGRTHTSRPVAAGTACQWTRKKGNREGVSGENKTDGQKKRSSRAGRRGAVSRGDGDRETTRTQPRPGRAFRRTVARLTAPRLEKLQVRTRGSRECWAHAPSCGRRRGAPCGERGQALTKQDSRVDVAGDSSAKSESQTCRTA